MKQAISNIVKLALIGGLIYVAINWQSMSASGGSDVERFAESACVDAVKSRYDVTGVRAYKTDAGTAIFRLKEHTDRLFRSAHILGMHMPYDKVTLNEVQRMAHTLLGHGGTP